MRRLLFSLLVLYPGLWLSPLLGEAFGQWLGSYGTSDTVSFNWTNVDSTVALTPIDADTVILTRFRQGSAVSPSLIDSTVLSGSGLSGVKVSTGSYVFRKKASDGSNNLGIYYADIKGWDYLNSKRVYGLYKTYAWSVTGSYNETRLVSTDTAGYLANNLDKTGYRLSATGVDDIWDEAQSGHTTAGTFGKRLDKDVSAIDDNPWDNPSRTLTSGAGTGANQVTVTVKYLLDSVVVNGVQVQVLNQTQTATEGLLTSNSLGQAVFALNNAVYKVRLWKPGFVFTVPESVVVSGNTNATFYGSAFNPGSPASPNLCRVYGYLKDINNLPAVGAKIEALNQTIPLKYQTLVISPYYKTTVTDINGYWYMDLFPNSILTPGSSKYRFNIGVPAGSVLRIETTVPNQTNWELSF